MPKHVLFAVLSVTLVASVAAGQFLLDTSAVYVPAPQSQMMPAVAYGAGLFFVIWSDSRGRNDLYGARVLANGTVLDHTGILISQDNDLFSGGPAIAFDGENFLVVWRKYGGGAYLRAARVTPAGVVLDSGGFVVSMGYQQYYPAVAFDGTNYLVAWQDERNGPSDDIYCTRVTPQGIVLDSAGVAVSTADGYQVVPCVACAGGYSIVAWENAFADSSDIYAARVSQTGTVLDPGGFAITRRTERPSFLPSVVSDGTQWLVVWAGYADTLREVRGARVTRGGVVLDTAGIAIAPGAERPRWPAVGYDSHSFVVTWSAENARDTGCVRAKRVTSDGIVLDTLGIVVTDVAESESPVAIAGGNAGSLLVWGDWLRSESEDLFGTRLTSDGVVLDTEGIPVATVANSQLRPAAASDGTDYLVVWIGEFGSEASMDIYGARVNSAGAVLDPKGFRVCTTEGTRTMPAAAFGGTTYLVVWVDGFDGGDIRGARITSDGEILEPPGFPITSEHSYVPVVASGGDTSLVVWTDKRNGSSNSDVYGARVTSAGAVLDPAGIPICTEPGNQEHPSVLFGTESYLVVWSEQPNYWNIRGARVSTSGVVLDTSGLDIEIHEGVQDEPDLAFGADEYFVVWADDRDGSEIYGARLTPQGAVLGVTRIASTHVQAIQGQPTVEYDGTDFLVMWEDKDSLSATDIYGARVNPAGLVVDSFPVVTHEGDEEHPALAHGPDAQMILAYSGWIGVVNGKSFQSQRIWGRLGPFPGLAEVAQTLLPKTRSVTIIRGTFLLPSASGVGRQVSSALLDISGRKVLDLLAGPNDVRHLATGIYFVRSTSGVEHGASSVTKVVLTR